MVPQFSHVRLFFIDNESVNDVTSGRDSLEGKLLVVKEGDVLESGPPCVRIMAALRYVTTIRKHLPPEDFSERNVTKVSLSTRAINSTSSITNTRSEIYICTDVLCLLVTMHYTIILFVIFTYNRTCA